MKEVKLKLKVINEEYPEFRCVLIANQNAKDVVNKVVREVGNVLRIRNIKWDLIEDILNSNSFLVNDLHSIRENVEILRTYLQKYLEENIESKENIHHIKLGLNKSNTGSILKPKEEPKKYTGYKVKLDLTDVENTLRNLIEEYTTKLNTPKYTQDIDFVKMLDSIKEAIQSKKVTVVETMGFISDLNDYLTDLVAGIYNA